MTGTDAGKREASSAASPEYEVGYRRPPKHSQYRKGQSGNPGGRPKRRQREASDFGAILKEILEQEISVSSNGHSKIVRKSDALIMSAVDRAMRSNQAARLLFEMLSRWPPSPYAALSADDSAVLQRKVEEMSKRYADSQESKVD
jgi:hypothetical protein